jgi:predicted unusual protein kinase regulating ubiquinone biosynthesis (AarF/ABC1/UbiB family)
MRLARTAPSGRLALARVAAAIELEWIPLPWGREIVSELESAARTVPGPLSRKQLHQILERAWGARARDELDELDEEPVAVTPIAQVHRGVLDGIPVAIKVLRPGLAGTIRQDLALLEGLLGPLGAAFPALDAGAVLAEVRQRVLDEFDLEHEAQMQRRFQRALRGHRSLHVPAPVTRLAAENVLVSEWVDGVPLRDAPDPDQAAAALVAFAFGAAREGLAHADLGPDDVLVADDGRLTILDFGASATIDRARAAVIADAVDAFASDDEEAFGLALERLGALAAPHAGTALSLLRDMLKELGGEAPSRLDSAAVVAARDRVLTNPDGIAQLIAVGRLPPQDLWPLRGAGAVFATVARVGATAPWRELVRDALREGWAA